jgi:hypothetical protein
MVYYFESEGKFMGLDLYNGEIYSQPNISVPGEGSSFGNFAYSCTDTSVYGLIMNNGVKALGKINPQTGVVTALPTVLNFDNYVMNSGGTIDPLSLVYYFQTLDTAGQVKMVGLSLLDGSVTTQSSVSTTGNYLTMYRIQSDCYEASPSRLNQTATISDIKDINLSIHPNPAQDFINLNSKNAILQVDILNADGTLIERIKTNEMNLQIPIESFANGIYFLKISSNNILFTKRFMKH